MKILDKKIRQIEVTIPGKVSWSFYERLIRVINRVVKPLFFNLQVTGAQAATTAPVPSTSAATTTASVAASTNTATTSAAAAEADTKEGSDSDDDDDEGWLFPFPEC